MKPYGFINIYCFFGVKEEAVFGRTVQKLVMKAAKY